MAQTKPTSIHKDHEEQVRNLAPLGLEPGSIIRFRRVDKGTWTIGKVARLEKDGSLGVFDGRGAFRAIQTEFCQVRRKGKQGGTVWKQI